MTDSVLRLDTSLGTILIAVHADRAPLTSAHVLGLVDDGHYSGAAFYRSTTLGDPDRPSLIQGGPLWPLFVPDGSAVPHIDPLVTVESSRKTGLHHRRGTVSLARDLVATGHVLPELFICLGDFAELDAGGRNEPDDLGFPAFGTIVEGLDVVAAIAARPIGTTSPIPRLDGEVLADPVPITHAVRLDGAHQEQPST